MSNIGRLNAYICGGIKPESGPGGGIVIRQPRGPRHRTVTIDRDDGTTPFQIQCTHEGCREPAYSQFYRVDKSLKPTHEWYKPDPPEYDRLSAGERQHVKRGGLLLREIVPAESVKGNKA